MKKILTFPFSVIGFVLKLFGVSIKIGEIDYEKLKKISLSAIFLFCAAGFVATSISCFVSVAGYQTTIDGYTLITCSSGLLALGISTLFSAVLMLIFFFRVIGKVSLSIEDCATSLSVALLIIGIIMSTVIAYCEQGKFEQQQVQKKEQQRQQVLKMHIHEKYQKSPWRIGSVVNITQIPAQQILIVKATVEKKYYFLRLDIPDEFKFSRILHLPKGARIGFKALKNDPILTTGKGYLELQYFTENPDTK